MIREMRVIHLTYFLGFIIFLIGISFFHNKIPQWKEATTTLFKTLETKPLTEEQWHLTAKEIQKLPSFFPISLIKDSAKEVDHIIKTVKNIEKTVHQNREKKTIKTDQIFIIFSHLRKLQESLQKIKQNTKTIPNILLSKEEQRKKDWFLEKIEQIDKKLEDIKTLQKVFSKLVASESRLMFLLQNQNEPRPTGGFVGAILIVDLSNNTINWKFEDIYALSRRVPDTEKIPAPDFFHDLSRTISLHDANFWPDFPTSAKQYIRFFKAINEKEPDVIISLNLNIIKELVKLGGPITLKNWEI